MPIPGSTLGFVNAPRIAADSPQAFPALATFLKKTSTTDTTGQELHVYVPVDSAHTDVPCRKSPLIQVRPQNQVQSQSDQIVQEYKYQLNIVTYLKDIVDDWQVLVTDPDGTTNRYQIKAVEADGNGLSMRFMLSKELPFNA